MNKQTKNLIIFASTVVIVAAGAVLYLNGRDGAEDPPTVTNYDTLAEASLASETLPRDLPAGAATPETAPPVNTDITNEFPDPNFRAAIRESLGVGENDPIMSNEAASLTELLYPQNTHAEDRSNVINDLTGIGYLESLETLDVSGNELSLLPELPAKIKSLNVSFNKLSSLPALPESLEFLDCGRNQLTELPEFPAHLTEIDVNGNLLTSLPKLPAGLTKLDCYGNKLTSLPALPDRLNSLSCGENQLEALPPLPPALYSLSFTDNKIAELSGLPDTLAYLMCGSNGLSALPTLPDSLIYISVFENTGNIDIDNAVFADGATVGERLAEGRLELER
jgi:hypothetical protein